MFIDIEIKIGMKVTLSDEAIENGIHRRSHPYIATVVYYAKTPGCFGIIKDGHKWPSVIHKSFLKPIFDDNI